MPCALFASFAAYLSFWRSMRPGLRPSGAVVAIDQTSFTSHSPRLRNHVEAICAV